LSPIIRRAARRAARLIVSAAVASAIVLWSAAPVAAPGELILQLSAERIQPGATIEVRGDLGTGEAFEVALVAKADGSRRLIGTITTVDEGHFQSYVTIPADAIPGDYLFEVAADLTVVRAPLTIAGSPIDPGGGGDGPDRGDGLIVPLPSGFGAGGGANASNPTAPFSPSGGSGSTRAGRSPIDGALVVGGAALLAIALLGVLRLTVRRRSGP
jgi:hypothetical protein